jgi:RHH-type proline utilization regulon transcriptional repressor/proline dehydrogenase/delta 1-pyrroline-5-carboxylate dehydrogenase
VIEMMMGAVCELVAGNPAEISTDLGPVLHIVRWQGDPQAVLAQINALGAVVGVQPLGGEGLSGTGPKADGPHYLLRFCAEQTVTVNTTAAGGNVQLLA